MHPPKAFDDKSYRCSVFISISQTLHYQSPNAEAQETELSLYFLDFASKTALQVVENIAYAEPLMWTMSHETVKFPAISSLCQALFYSLLELYDSVLWLFWPVDSSQG
ncbi:hypothetical protein P7K49_007492 [Saguinus oedipus]|uniref:Uncharacterized protein n=1 Tax=Saguinus oedipus TaxID=9490 RepID=A0ABQ9VVQ8_SAGOE|nr:hypothetical protein P7K49_007492 [Saguinus oedipus]